MKFHVAVFLCVLAVPHTAHAQQTQAQPSIPTGGAGGVSKEPNAAPETKPENAAISLPAALNLYNSGQIASAAHALEEIIQQGGADVPAS